MSRLLVRLFLLLALPWPAARAAVPAPVLAITFAEQSARLVRDTAIHRAGRGVVLRANDMLESGSGAIQFEAGGATLALGPASRVFVKNGGELVLLDGWLKLHGRADRAFTVATSNLQLASAGSTVTLHAAGAASELFAESGEVLVHELDGGKRKRSAGVPHEHFAVRSGALPLRLADRPPPAFLAAMPRSFRDDLVALPAGGAPIAPHHERPATFAELAPWLAAHPTLRRQVQMRFDPPRAARSAPAPARPRNAKE